jgi:TetR/AcrR family transcriptional repressor of mexJK operon
MSSLPSHKRAAPRRSRGRPVNAMRREEILDVAGKLFLERGYQRTTIDELAKRLGMSKLTLYSRFADKEALFSAVIESKCHEYIPANLFAGLEGVPVRDFLMGVARGLCRLLVSDDATKMERLIMTEGPERTRLAHIFFEAGPLRVKRMIASELVRYRNLGELEFVDATLATNLFSALIRGSDLCMRRMMLGTAAPGGTEVENYCQAVVDVFLLAHSPRKSR